MNDREQQEPIHLEIEGTINKTIENEGINKTKENNHNNNASLNENDKKQIKKIEKYSRTFNQSSISSKLSNKQNIESKTDSKSDNSDNSSTTHSELSNKINYSNDSNSEINSEANSEFNSEFNGIFSRDTSKQESYYNIQSLAVSAHLLLHIHSVIIYNPLTHKSISKASPSASGGNTSKNEKNNHVQLYIDIRHPFTYSPISRTISVSCIEDELKFVGIIHDLGPFGLVNSKKNPIESQYKQGDSSNSSWKHYAEVRNQKAVSIALRYDQQIRMGVHTLYDLDDFNSLLNLDGTKNNISNETNDDNKYWNCKESSLLFGSRWINKVIELRIRIIKKYPLFFSLNISNFLSTIKNHKTNEDTTYQFIIKHNYDERNHKLKKGQEINILNGISEVLPIANSFSIDVNSISMDESHNSRITRIKQFLIRIEDMINLCIKESDIEKKQSQSYPIVKHSIQIQENDYSKVVSLGKNNEYNFTTIISNIELRFQLPKSIVIPHFGKPLDEEMVLNSDSKNYIEQNDYNLYTFKYPSLIPRNKVEILLDGLQTFSRYYHYMMQAKKSINIIGWELSLTFGLVYVPTQKDPREVKTRILHFGKLKKFLRKHNLWPADTTRRWITLQDVLLAKAAQGVKIKIIVWRHNFISTLNRYLYLGEFTIEREVEKLKKKAASMNIRVVSLHYSMPLTPNSEFSDPFAKHNADIVVLIVGNPKGIVSCCHEKLVLVDAELPARTVAFTGGFDIARGRFDQPKHLPPKPLFDWQSFFYNDKEERYSGKEVQPFFRHIRMLWHDSQVMIQGPSTRTLYLHFAQRWSQAFHSNSVSIPRKLKLPLVKKLGKPFEDPISTDIHPFFTQSAPVRIFRQWPTVLQTHVLEDHFCNLINRAKKYIYVEHQYPFHSFALSHCMCEALKRNPDLKVIVVAPIKNDLPNGIIGSLLDISSDHIIEHLNMIYNVAPNRFAAYGIVRQEPTTKSLKTVYVHSKLILVDDEIISIGSSNLDYLSFCQSSEIQLEIYNRELCVNTKLRLLEEHLEEHFIENLMKDDFDHVFEVFKRTSMNNYVSYKTTGIVHGRPFSITPKNHYIFALSHIHVPSIIGKTLFKFGITPTIIKKYLPIQSFPCCRKRIFLQSRL